MICIFCGENLTAEEIESPHLDSGGNPICDDCYYDHYCSICPVCEDHYESDDEESEIFILFEDFGVPPGIYRPINHPFYTQGLIGDPIVYAYDVERIAGLESIDDDLKEEPVYPATFVCLSCEKTILADAKREILFRSFAAPQCGKKQD